MLASRIGGVGPWAGFVEEAGVVLEGGFARYGFAEGGGGGVSGGVEDDVVVWIPRVVCGWGWDVVCVDASIFHTVHATGCSSCALCFLNVLGKCLLLACCKRLCGLSKM